jgi:hypothetical protein
MNKLILNVVACFFAVTIIGQNTDSGNLYKSIEDYKAKKPVEGVSVVPDSWRMLFGSESIELVKNGASEKTKLGNVPATVLTLEKDGMLMRIFEKDLYIVVVEGPLCYYRKRTEGRVGRNGSEFYFSRNSKDDNWGRDFYSEGINGEIKKLKESELEKRIEEKGLKAKYEADKPKRERKDSVDDYMTKSKNRVAKYIKLLNEKAK